MRIATNIFNLHKLKIYFLYDAQLSVTFLIIEQFVHCKLSAQKSSKTLNCQCPLFKDNLYYLLTCFLWGFNFYTSTEIDLYDNGIMLNGSNFIKDSFSFIS